MRITDTDILEAIETRGGAIPLPMFDGALLSIFSELDDINSAQAVDVVRALLAKEPAERDEAARHLLAHFNMMSRAVHDPTQILEELNGVAPVLDTIWNGVKLSGLELAQATETPWQTPDFDPGKPIYVVLDLSVPWDREHSVIMSWENGSVLVKVGEYGSPVHDLEQLGEGHQTCIFHCPTYDLCTRPD